MLVGNYLHCCFLRLGQSVHVSDSLLLLVVLESLPFVVLPNQFFKLTEVAEERDSPASVHEGGLEDPEVRVGLAEKGFGAGGLAVKVSLRFLVQLLCGKVGDVLGPRQ